ncbi:MAG TPA: hypothetical protein VGC42_25900 [Kofleriaceae bacterium]
MPTPNSNVHLSVVAEPVALEDPVPPSVRAVLDLYGSQLAKVAFPEIDAASLRRQADELRGEAKAVAKAREQLDTALAGFAARMAVLSDTAARAVAYARIYSDAHPERGELASALTALATPSDGEPAKPALTANGKRRGRPPKRSAELFDDAAARAASAAVDAALDGAPDDELAEA